MANSGPITLLTSGTRGDVQPYVALGLGLREAGHRVRLVAPEAFRSFVAPSGLPFAGFAGNPSELLARPDAQAALNDSGNLIRTLQASLRYARDARPVYRQMLASAWGGGAWDDGVWGDGEPSRAAAQTWLREQGYEPTVFEGSRPLFWLSTFLPWLHRDDHPVEDLEAARYRVSMPASLQAFVQRREPDTLRLEICHDEQRVVVRRGGAPFPAGCVPEAGDIDISLD